MNSWHGSRRRRQCQARSCTRQKYPSRAPSTDRLSLRNVTSFCLWERTAESATAARPVGSCLVKAPHIPRPAHHRLNRSKQSLPEPAWMQRSITGTYLSYPPQWTHAILLSSPIICFRFICALDCLGHLTERFEPVNTLGGPLTARKAGERTNSPPLSIRPSVSTSVQLDPAGRSYGRELTLLYWVIRLSIKAFINDLRGTGDGMNDLYCLSVATWRMYCVRSGWRCIGVILEECMDGFAEPGHNGMEFTV